MYEFQSVSTIRLCLKITCNKSFLESGRRRDSQICASFYPGPRGPIDNPPRSENRDARWRTKFSGFPWRIIENLWDQGSLPPSLMDKGRVVSWSTNHKQLIFCSQNATTSSRVVNVMPGQIKTSVC